jgi:hypothetical protein
MAVGPATATAGATRGGVADPAVPAAPAPAAPRGGSVGSGTGDGSGYLSIPENSPTPTTPKETVAAPTANPYVPNSQGLLLELKASFPWLEQLGFSPEFFQNLVAEAASADEVMVKLRQAPQYQQRFPGLWRADGSIRMNEAQYLQTETNFRQVLQQYGYADTYTTPSSLKGFFDTDMDANELAKRLDTYQLIQVGGQATKDAFYTYAGLRVSDDDLYAATVDPAKNAELTRQYNESVAKSPFDYATYIARATELGLERVANDLQQMQGQGFATGTVVSQVLRTNPDFAQQMMDVLYQSGGNLSLQELLSSFQLATIGGAAAGNGLSLPTKERAQQIVAAGVDRAKAMDAYSQYGQFQNLYGEAVRRAGQGIFGQSEFEDASFLGDAADQGRLAAGLARETAAGKQTGNFQIRQDNFGRFSQSGFSTPTA